MQIEPMADRHAVAVLATYQAGLDEGNATFDTRVPSCRVPDGRTREGIGRHHRRWRDVLLIEPRSPAI